MCCPLRNPLQPWPQLSDQKCSMVPNPLTSIQVILISPLKNYEAKSACLLHAKLLQSCLTLHNPMDCSPPGSSDHGILQTRILEWLPCPPPGDPDSGIEPMPLVSPAVTSGFFTTSTTWEAREAKREARKRSSPTTPSKDERQRGLGICMSSVTTAPAPTRTPAPSPL